MRSWRTGLATKITAGLVVIVVVGVAALLVVYEGLARVDLAMRYLAEVKEPVNAATYEMEINVNGMTLGVLKYVDAPEPRYRRLVEDDAQDFERFHARFLRLVETDVERRLGDQIGRFYQQFKEVGWTLIARRDQQEAVFTTIARNFEVIDDVIDNRLVAGMASSDQERAAKVEALTYIEADIAEAGLWLANYQRTRDPKLKAMVVDHDAELRATLRRFTALPLTLAEREWSDVLRRRLDQTLASIMELAALEDTQRLGTDQFAELRSQLDRLLDEELQILTLEQLAVPPQNAAEATASAVARVRVLIPGFIFTAAALGFLLVAVVTRPLRRLMRGTEVIGQGDLSHRIQLKGHDEFADLAEHFNRMVARLEAMLVSKDLLEASEKQLERTVESLRQQIVERQRAEEEGTRLEAAVQRSEAEWALTFDAIDSAVVMLDHQGRVTQANRAARALSNCATDVAGKAIGGLSTVQPWLKVEQLVAQVRRTGAAASGQAADANTRQTWDLDVNPLTRAGIPDRIVVVARNVTGVVELQASLHRTESMSAMGALVAGVAHEVRNPLFGMSSTLDAMEARLGERVEYQPYSIVLRGELERLSRLMQDLLEYGKPAPREHTPDSIEAVVAQAIQICTSLAGRGGVDIVGHVPSGLPPVAMDRTRLVQVFQNLLENAVQHSPPGGTVTLEARAVSKGGRVCIECAVEDAGRGFREEDLPLIFTPFFSRRPEGTGLGLSIVQRIVEEHAGRVAAGNSPAAGAVVTVTLPVSHPEPVAAGEREYDAEQDPNRR